MLTTRRNVLLALALGLVFVPVVGGAQSEGGAGAYEYRLLATNKTSTMEKELNQAGGEGFRYGHVMGGETGFGGSEVVVVMTRDPAAPAEPRYQYPLQVLLWEEDLLKEYFQTLFPVFLQRVLHPLNHPYLPKVDHQEVVLPVRP